MHVRTGDEVGVATRWVSLDEELGMATRWVPLDEELGMATRWVPLDEARDAVLAGKIHNPGSVIGIRAACVSRDLGWSTLRPPDSPWPEHHAFR